MKLAVSGKGGSGKTTLSGTLARLFATDGLDVLAIDADVTPNLALALGIPDEHEVAPLPDDLLQRVETFGDERETSFSLAKTSQEIIDDYAVEAPAGVKLVKNGEVDEAGSGGMCVSHHTGREVLAGLAEEHNEVVVMDIFAGVEHLARGIPEPVDTLFVVVEPYYQSLKTGLDTVELAVELGIEDVRVVANKVRDQADRDVIEEFSAENALDIHAVIPYDDAIRRANQEGVAPFDYAPESDGIQSIRELADALLAAHA